MVFDALSELCLYLQMSEMTPFIRGALMKVLKDNTWMDEVTRRAALAKAGAIVEKIGYDERILNNTYLNQLYKRGRI